MHTFFSMSFQAVVENFKLNGCMYLEHADLSINSAWIDDLFFVDSPDRSQLLEWWLRKLSPEQEIPFAADMIRMMGLLSASDASSFVSGKMTRSKQLSVWSNLSRLKLQDANEDTEMEDERNKRLVAFIETLAETVDFDKFKTSKLNIVPFHIDKELKKNKGNSKLQDCSLPTIEHLTETLEQGKVLYDDLQQYAEVNDEDSQDNSEFIQRLEEVSQDINEKLDEFSIKYNTEFSSWVNPRHNISNEKEKPEIREADDIIHKLSTHFSRKTSIAGKVEKILDIGFKDLKKMTNSINVHDVTEGEENPRSTLSTLSRAPAAS